MKINILLCYGVFEESNQEYRQYVEMVVKETQENQVEKIIVCGGHTNSKSPEISEAETVRNYIIKLNPGILVELEDQSLTTPQNLEFVSRTINSTDKITVYCDLARMAKVIWLSLTYLLHKNRQETVAIFFNFSKDQKLKPFVHENLSVKYFDFPSRDKYLCIAQTFSSLLEVEAIYNPEIENKIIEQRKIDFGIQ